MSDLRQAAQQALEALTLSIPKPRPADDDYAELGWKEHNAAITALRAALAEPEQEPLTDEKIEALWQNTSPYYDHQDFARAIERAHGIGEQHE